METNRREFLKASGIIGLTLAGNGVLSAAAFPSTKGPANQTKGLDIPGLRKAYADALLNKFIPNMNKYVVDHEFGGFMTSVNILTFAHVNTDKRAWFEGRGMWMYSFLYNNIKKDPEYLKIVEKSRDFILKQLPADGSYYISSFSREGKPLSTVPGDIYGNLFVAEGLAEYSKAVGDKKWLDLAKDIMFKAVERYDRPDFTYNYKAAKVEPGPRILGHWMILLSLCTQMLRQEPDPKVKALADRCVDAVLNHHLNPAGVLLEALDHNLNILPDPVASNFGDIGHGCETLAFIMNYAVLTKDKALFDRAGGEFKRHVEIARDKVYGGHFHALNNIETNEYTLTKVRWLQEEILIGALILMEHTADDWAYKTYAETERYIRDKFVRPEYGFVIDSGDRKVEKHSQVRAEHYHYPRQLMVCILAFDRMIKRNYRPSGVFS